MFFPVGFGATLFTNTKFICWEHSNTNLVSNHKFKKASRWMGAKFADKVIVLTKQDESDYFKKYRPKSLVQIYNPIDPNIFNISSTYDIDSKKIISVGSLCNRKNFTLLLDVAKMIFEKYVDWTWDICGEGEEREVLQNKIFELGLQDFVKLKGVVSNLYELYSQYSIMVMTSKSEGFPMALIEGMAKKLPLISFDIYTGPNEIIFDGRNGFLIKPFEVEVFAERICQLIENRELRMEMSKQNDILAENFHIGSISSKWASVIYDTLGVEKHEK